jgi:hypothetical protein
VVTSMRATAPTRWGPAGWRSFASLILLLLGFWRPDGDGRALSDLTGSLVSPRAVN